MLAYGLKEINIEGISKKIDILRKVVKSDPFRKNITLMKTEITYNQLATWSDQMLSQGRYGFALSEIKESHVRQSDTAIKSALKRLTDKGKLLSVFKGYYLIIPPSMHLKVFCLHKCS